MKQDKASLEKQLRHVTDEMFYQKQNERLYIENIRELNEEIREAKEARTDLKNLLINKDVFINDLLIEQNEYKVKIEEYNKHIENYRENIEKLQNKNINTLVDLRKAQTDATEQRNVVERLKWYKEIECEYECQNDNSIASRILPRREEKQKCIPRCVEKKMTEEPQPGLNLGSLGGSSEKHVLYNMRQYVVHKKGKYKFIKVHKKPVFLSDIKGQYSYVKQVRKKTSPSA